MYTVSVWSGGKYSVDYVHAIKKQLPGVIVLGHDTPLETNWLGWGAKIELFSPWFNFRPCLYVDLDTYILGDIEHMLTPPERLTLIRDFNQQNRGNSGVMKIPADTSDIWAGCQNYDGVRPDGDLLNTFPHDYLQDQYPNEIKSYKVDKLQFQKPDCKIMCFHGRPKPHEAKGWAGDLWQELSSNS